MATPVEQVRRLYELVTEGGVVLIMNDFDQEPTFSRTEAEQAGFQIVRWGALRPLPAPFMELMPYSAHERNPGIMNLTVLRRGNVRSERVEFTKTRMPPSNP
jgi:hypothetical protein